MLSAILVKYEALWDFTPTQVGNEESMRKGTL